jgi:hypothetical protein
MVSDQIVKASPEQLSDGVNCRLLALLDHQAAGAAPDPTRPVSCVAVALKCRRPGLALRGCSTAKSAVH